MGFLRASSISLLFFTLTSITLNAQVSISGNAPSYKGMEVVLYQYADFITQTEEIIARCNVGNDGEFSCNLQVDETTYLFGYLGIYKIYLFIEPERNYRIVLPEYEPQTEPQRLNPFFRFIDLHVGIENMEKLDLNFLISSFDLAFNQHFDQIVLDAYVGRKNIILDSLIHNLEQTYNTYKHTFFDAYRNYRYGLLSQLSFMQQSRSISENYFLNKPILYNNPSYMELFNLLYDKYFLFFARSESGTAVFSNISNQRSYTNLKETLRQDNVLANDTLLELVILKGLHDGFFDDKFSRRALLTILDSLYTQTKIAEHLIIAQNIRSRVTRLLPGFVPTPFELYTIDGTLKSLNSFKGKYVYLNFCTASSYSCLQEFALLEMLYTKHKNRIEIVTISVDSEIDDLKVFLDQTNYEWTFLHYGNKPEIIKDFDVRAYPTYFLIGPDQRLIMSPAASPKEDFETLLFNLLRSRGEL